MKSIVKIVLLYILLIAPIGAIVYLELYPNKKNSPICYDTKREVEKTTFVACYRAVMQLATNNTDYSYWNSECETMSKEFGSKYK